VYFLKLMPLLPSRRRYPGGLLPILALALLASCGGGKTRPPPPADVTVSVQLDRPLPGRHSASGFLHALTPTDPPDRLVAPLCPRLWRSDLLRAPVRRALALGARYEVVLSDFWGYPKDGWRGHGPPWRDLGRWAGLVRQVARSQRGRPLLWDVWNEPNRPESFGGGLRRFLRVYAVARRALRQELGPGAQIGGPSTAGFRPAWLTALLRCCGAEFLSWHANLRPPEPIASITADLRAARRLGRPVEVNESVGEADQYLPGEIVGYLAAIEAGGADAAARACWPDSRGRSNCGADTLDGLLTRAGVPRAAWWAYRWYAATTAEARVGASASDGRVAALASGGSPARVLLGRAARGQTGGLDLDLALRGLPDGDAPVRVEALPAAGERPLPEPRLLFAGEVHVDHGRADVRVPGLAPHEAALVTVGSDHPGG
jgi:hypothetical protein